MNMHPVNVTALKSLSLIEASAGTGKTWTLTGLYLRALLEEKLSVESIVVITFTRAATAELKERIIQRIKEKISEYESAVILPADKAPSNHESDLLRLRVALASADQMVVTTIHAFCQRLLNMGFGFVNEVQDIKVLNNTDQLIAQLRDEFLQEIFALGEDSNKQDEAYLLAQWYESFGEKLPFARALLHPIKPSIYQGAHAFKILDNVRKARQALRLLTFEQIEQWVAFTAQHSRLNKRTFNTTYRQEAPKKALHFFGQKKWLLSDDSEKKLLQRLAWQADKMGLENEAAPPNPVYEAARLYLKAIGELDGVKAWLMFEFRRYALDRIEELKRETGVIVQDDYILRLRQALVSADRSDVFNNNREFALKEVRSRYPLALVDETQDTDQAAWDILFAIYQPIGGLIAVGDPKQTIYRFRGADVHAYMAARERCTHRFELTENFRSTPELIAAFNKIFSAPNAFVLKGIEFAQARVGGLRAAQLMRNEQKVPAISWHVLPDGKNGDDQLAAAWVIKEIQTLFKDSLCASSAECSSVQPNDIAVLVDTARQASLVRHALAQVGIAATEKSRETVLVSEEAQDLIDILQGLILPKHRGYVSKALATRVAGYDQLSLFKLRDDADVFNAIFEQLSQCSLIWQQSGAYSAFLFLFSLWNTESRFMRLRLGERRWANILHCCELIAAESSACANPASAMRWLVTLRQGAQSQVDAETLLVRTETDQSQIQILTIHTSKGLEFPIVLIPFAIPASPPKREKNWPDLALGAVQFDYPLLPAVDAQVLAESRAENVRKVYVAVTRAKSHCSVFLLRRAKFDAGPWLELFADHQRAASSDGAVGVAQAKNLLRQWADRMPASFSFHEWADFDPAKITGAATQNVVHTPHLVPTPTKSIARKPSWFPVSFSALAARAGAHSGFDTPEVFLRDHDAQQTLIETIQVEEGLGARTNIRWTFERGEQAGQFLHKVFEHHWLNAKNRRLTQWGHAQLTAQSLAQWASSFGIRSDLTECADWFNSVLATPLIIHEGKQSSFSLNQLQPTAAQAEFEFLMTMLDGHWRLRGFIDLVFEVDGRYYVLDWKSNYLGNQADDYRPEVLAQIMQSEQYNLQASLYSLAMHRWLESRAAQHLIEPYDYERDFGGVFYLFVRGMGLGNPLHGVYFHKPELQQLIALQRDGSLAGGARS
jgi:exodeoxyribonuclease V beta subunit